MSLTPPGRPTRVGTSKASSDRTTTRTATASSAGNAIRSDMSLRMALPALLAVAVLVVVRSLEAFEVPTLVGLPGGVKLMTTEIYLDMKKSVPPDLGYASAFSVVLLLLAAVLLYFYSRLIRNAARFH